MKNFEPKLPPAATGSTLSLLVGTFRHAASSHWKYVKFIEFAHTVTTPVPRSKSPIAPFVSMGIAVDRGQRSLACTLRGARSNVPSTSPNVNVRS